MNVRPSLPSRFLQLPELEPDHILNAVPGIDEANMPPDDHVPVAAWSGWQPVPQFRGHRVNAAPQRRGESHTNLQPGLESRR